VALLIAQTFEVFKTSKVYCLKAILTKSLPFISEKYTLLKNKKTDWKIILNLTIVYITVALTGVGEVAVTHQNDEERKVFCIEDVTSEHTALQYLSGAM
jgi:hypothetical protein